MEDVDIFLGQLVFITRICFTYFWSFDKFCGHLVHFFSFWYVVRRKIWQPCTDINTLAKEWRTQWPFPALCIELLRTKNVSFNLFCNLNRQTLACRYVHTYSLLGFFASYAKSRLSQGNLNQPDVAFCSMSAAIS
jgi:hypothetical protein